MKHKTMYLSVLLALTTAGCGGGSGSSDDGNTSSGVSSTATAEQRISSDEIKIDSGYWVYESNYTTSYSADRGDGTLLEVDSQGRSISNHIYKNTDDGMYHSNCFYEYNVPLESDQSSDLQTELATFDSSEIIKLSDDHYRVSGKSGFYNLEWTMEMQRISDATTFNQGTVSVTGSMITDVNATDDVCVDYETGSDSVNVEESLFEYQIALPYEGTRMHITITIIGSEPPEPGVYPLKDSEHNISVHAYLSDSVGIVGSSSTSLLNYVHEGFIEIEEASDTSLKGNFEMRNYPGDFVNASFDLTIP